MSKRKLAAQPSDTTSLETTLVGDAAAAGQETFTSVDATVDAGNLSNKSFVKGQITAVAVVEPIEGEQTFTDAFTDVSVTAADTIKIKTKIVSASNGETSETSFKATDHYGEDGDPKVTYKVKEKSVDEIPIDPDGNVAIATFDAQATGENTLVQVDAAALAVEDELSLSTVVVVTAIG